MAIHTHTHRHTHTHTDTHTHRLAHPLSPLLLSPSLSSKALESILVTRATQQRSARRASGSSGSNGSGDGDVVDTVLDIRGVADAFAALQERLLEPEMRYRLQHEASRRYLKQLISKDPDGPFALYVQWCQEDARCDRHSLADLLTQPLQRLTRYPLLLKAILKHMLEDDPNR